MRKLQWHYAAGLIRTTQPTEGEPGGGTTPPAKPKDGTTSPWDTAFAGQTPEQVKKALDESRKWEQRAKDNAEAAKERDVLKAAADQSKSNEEKLLERLTILEAKDAASEQREQIAAWAKDIIKAHEGTKVTPSALRGTTKEDLEQHFAELNALIGTGEPAKKGATAPYVPSEGQSPSGGEPKESTARPGTGTLREAYAEEATTK